MSRPTTPTQTTMANATVPTSQAPAATPQARRRGRPPKPGPKTPPKPKTTRPGAGLSGSPEAKRRASLVLEVLGGLRSPTSASAALGVSIQRYYLLEVRALQGLVSALDAKPKRGAQPSPETTLRKLTAERDRLERELLRAQSLLRVAQRAVGLSPATETTTAKSGKKGSDAGRPGSKRKRTPTVRARRAAETLRAAARAEDMTPTPPETPASATT